MKYKLQHVAIGFLFLILGIACGRTKLQESHPLIVGNTGGTISVLSPVVVRFTDDTEFLLAPVAGETLPASVLTVRPKTEGEIRWLDERTLEFRPKTALKHGAEYVFTLNIGKISQIPEKVSEKFTFAIQTLSPAFETTVGDIRTYPSGEEGVYYVAGMVTTSDYITNEDAEELLHLQPGKWTPQWEHNERGTVHTFRIDSLRSQEKDFNLLLRWNGRVIKRDLQYSDTVSIPERGAFRMNSLKVEYTPEFRVTATFTQPLDKNQRLEEYIFMGGGSDLRLVAEQNRVYIYMPQAMVGEKIFRVEAGIRSRTGMRISERKEYTLKFDNLAPSVQFIGSGTVLPSASGMKLPFKAINFGAVDVRVIKIYENNILAFLQNNNLDGEWDITRFGRIVAEKRIVLTDAASVSDSRGIYSLDLSSILKPEPGAIYRVMLRGAEPLVEANSDEYEWVSEEYFGEYKTRKERIRNIIASDLGIIVKAGVSNVFHIYVADLVTAAPKSGVVVTAYNSVNQPIGNVTTDGSGMGVLSLTEEPRTLMAQGSDSRGYLKVMEGQNLSVSGFDVAGDAVKKGIRCYLYGERGVWRPGDDIFLTALLYDRNQSLPEGHPIKLDFYNPMGQLVKDVIYRVNRSGMYVFYLKTKPDDPTGNWEVVLSVGGEEFRKRIKVETVKPNRLKIEMHLNEKPILEADHIRADLSTQWLHGAAGANLRSTVEMKLSKMKTSFKGYEKYSFEDHSKTFSHEMQEIFSGFTDGAGKTSFTKELSNLHHAPGMLNAQFVTRVFEQGGDFSIDSYTTRLSPYKSYVGLLRPTGSGYYEMLEKGEKQRFEVVTLSPDGVPVGRNGVKVEIVRMDWSWWWNSSSDDGLAAYSADEYYTPLYRSEISTVNGRGHFEYTWSEGDYGWYFIRVTDPQGHSSNQVCYVGSSYEDQTPAGGAGASATLLNLTTDQEKYAPGEKAVVSFPSAQGAKALITLETGSQVLRSWWVECDPKRTSVKIAVTADMAPNVYVGVSLLQPYERTDNDAPIRMYGAIPLRVENRASRIEPVIQMPQTVRPEQEFTVKVSERSKRGMTYTLALVDEGLLGLTRFATPDPWGTFYSKEALGIRTWDLYDYVIGAYGGRIQQLFTIGGDGEIDRKSASRAQRFKPVVKFMGPFTVKEGKTELHKITLPPYIGAVRVMVVAADASAGAFGSAETTVEVRKPLMITQTLPRVMGTGEEVVMPVTVFATEKGVGKVNVEIIRSEGFEVVGAKSLQVNLPDKGEKLVFFRLKSHSVPGIGKVEVVASCMTDKTSEQIELEVRNPNPRITFSETFLVEKGEVFEGKFSLVGMKGTNDLNLELSVMPPLNLGKRLKYLVTYPHGCIEQITSGAFPQLYLGALTDSKTMERSATNVKSVLDRLSSYQTAGGGFSYWQGGKEVNAWGTTYAGHFLIEAERMGFAVSGTLKSNWLQYQKSAARLWNSDSGDPIIQAYRLYVLALAGEAERGAMNRMLEISGLEDNSRWLLAGAYVADGKTETARKMVASATMGVKQQNPFSWDFGSYERDKAVALLVLTAMGERSKTFPLIKELSEALNSSDWFSTQTTAWMLMSLSRCNDPATPAQIKASYGIAESKMKVDMKQAIYTVPVDISGLWGEVPVRIANVGESPLYAVLSCSGIPEQGQERTFANNLTLSVRYSQKSGAAIHPAQIKQGTDFEAEVTVQNTSIRTDYTNLVLTEIFPSGWEIASVTAYGTSEAEKYDYRDTRDDRVLTYFGLKSGESRRFTVRLTATYAGRFYMPAIVCGAMYDGTVGAAVEGLWCEVTKNE